MEPDGKLGILTPIKDATAISDMLSHRPDWGNYHGRRHSSRLHSQ